VRKLVVAASLVAVSTSIMAMDLEYYLGAGAQRVSLNIESSFSEENTANEESAKDTAFLLKGGIILEKAHRISLSYSIMSEENADITTILANYDYLFPMNDQFKLYAGFHAGNTKVDVSSFDYIDGFSYSGFAYGIQSGAIYDITKNIQFEAGLSYTKFNVTKEENRGIDNNGMNYTLSGVELKDAISMFAGLNYKF
jgi:opacity protein-like surface antigen